ncbi:MAG: HDOD domain-containing protein [Burkholderiales bacterium]|nr:HDOD domain-containing protein [Burkholderiales bacterium]
MSMNDETFVPPGTPALAPPPGVARGEASGQHRNIGRFPILSEIGRGGQATVYLGADPELDRRVAIKLLRAADDGPVALARLLEEGRNLARLRHPHIVSLFECGRHAGRPYLVFEYVDGSTLAAVLQERGKLPPQEALDLTCRIAEGLAHAHAQGVSHLDLSPGNIMIDRDGVPRIMDFGLSRLRTRDADASVVAGTPRWMAPEQYDGGALGAHTDVFALGLIAYRMLTGVPAYRVLGFEELARSALRDTIDFECLRRHGVNGEFEAALRAALAREVAQRIPDAAALLGRLRAGGGGARAPRHATVEFLLRRMQTKKGFPALSASLAAVNQMTAPEGNVSTGELASAVLRDLSLAGGLLRLANSAYYGVPGREIRTVTEAITRLGFEQVRQACNALLYAARLEDADPVRARLLRDAKIESFVAALIARHLAAGAGPGVAEEAFLCGMFRCLGETLTLYCFPEEYAAIAEACANGAERSHAYREALGICAHEIGMAVAREWKLPDTLVQSMRPLEASPVPAPASRADRLLVFAGFGNELCQLGTRVDAVCRDAALDELAGRYGECFEVTPSAARHLLCAAVEKFRQFEPILGVRAADSTALRRLYDWSAQVPQEIDAASASAGPGEPQPAPAAVASRDRPSAAEAPRPARQREASRSKWSPRRLLRFIFRRQALRAD